MDGVDGVDGGDAPVSWPPAAVTAVTDRFLELVDRALPGALEGLYLHGSLGFGEWYDGRRDVDFVAVHAARPGPEEVAVLAEVHEEMASGPVAFDGSHVTWDDLAGPPGRCPDVPGTLGGWFTEAGRVDVNPVTWHELAGHGVRVRGPALRAVRIWTDATALRRYTRDNLASYWAEQGTARLHHLLTTGRLTTKCGAGRHALTAFDERWHPVVREALAIRETGRQGPAYPGGAEQRARDTAGFAAMVVKAGLAIPV